MLINFLYILIACALYGVLHSYLASMGVKAAAERRFGQAGKRYYRLFYVIQSTITLLPVMALLRILPDQTLYRIPFPYIVIFLVLQLLSTAGVLLSVAQTGGMSFIGLEQAFNPASLERPSKLVEGGFYRLVRHPIYTFGLLFLLFSPVVTWNWLAFSAGMAGYILAGIIFEERKLEGEFGQAYRDYKKRVPMLLPRLKIK